MFGIRTTRTVCSNCKAGTRTLDIVSERDES